MSQLRAESVAQDPNWWREAVVYQVYVRSFSDASGDGEGDIAGIASRLDYLAELGVDALWITPWYLSPLADGGYDIADYRQIDPRFGDLREAEELIQRAHELGLRVLIDLVPNHTSREHEWFEAALAGDEKARQRYWFRHGRDGSDAEPPNDWLSAFGGSAWERVDGEDLWYLHLYSVDQPDLNWENPEVVEEFQQILQFWFDRGVDGVRIDVAHGMVKADGLPDAGVVEAAQQFTKPHPAWNQDGVHDIFRTWRALADRQDPKRIFVAEAWVPTPAQLARYVRKDELHLAFQMDMCFTPWSAPAYRATIDESLAASRVVEAPTTWVLANHDVPRTVTRYGRSQPEGRLLPDWDRRRWGQEPVDLALGTDRARAAALITVALPGSLYLYQGEELGLPEHETIASELRQDPTWWQSDYTEPGRDGCRIPLPWSAEGRSLGFSPVDAHAEPWLPQPAPWAELAVDRQEGDPGSMLHLYREALRIRRERLLDEPAFSWLPSAGDVLSFRRGSLTVVANFGAEPVALPAGRVLLASRPLEGGRLAGNSSAFIEGDES